MSKQAIMSQVTARLSQLGIPYQIGQNADITIFNEFVDAGWSTGTKKIVYEASILLDEAQQIVWMWEKTVESGGGFSGGFSGSSTFQSGTTLFRKVRCIQYGPDGKAFEVNLDLGAIPKSVKEAASQSGWKFKTVLSKEKAQYRPGSNVAQSIEKLAPLVDQVARSRFCGHCGSPLEPEARFCPACGQPVQPVQATQPGQPFQPVQPVNPAQDQAAQQTQPYQPVQPYQPMQPMQPAQRTAPAVPAAPVRTTRSIYNTLAFTAYGLLTVTSVILFIVSKNSPVGWLIALPLLGISALVQFILAKRPPASASGSPGCVPGFVIFIVTAALVLGTFIATKDRAVVRGETGSTTAGTTAATSGTGQTQATNNDKSSVVSKGVNLDDLGNIINGQYFFDNGQYQFYSSYDESFAAHIYRTDIASGKTGTIFDGFGWSLVTHKDWLYFSGNPGTAIDGTYNLFRMKPDGSSLEKINPGFCYNMSIYKDWLYYIKRSDMSSTDYTICRANLDGSSEEVLVTDFNGFCVIYENALYYAAKDGTFNRAKTDGSDPVALLEDRVMNVIIGNGKLIYVDTGGNIKVAGIDGKNAVQIRAAGSLPVYSLNSMKDKIFYTVYDPTAVADRYAYAYELYRINFDGTGNEKIYNEVSYGTYINVVNNKVLTMDYAIDVASGKMPAVARQMNFDGSGAADLPR